MNLLESILLWCDTVNPRGAQARLDSRIRRVLAGRYSATVSRDALFIADDAGYLLLQAAMRNGTTVTLVRNEEGANIEQATAVVASLSTAAPDQDVATVSASFEIDNAWVELGT